MMIRALRHTLKHTLRQKSKFSTSSNKPLVVVMDIDECMVHAQFEDDEGYRQDDNRESSGYENDGNGESKKLDTVHIACEDGMPVKLNIRPGLHDFLESMVSRNYTVLAFTAALPVYARPVLNYLDPKGDIFQKRWFRHDCTLMKVQGYSLYGKDIMKRGALDPTRSLLVDNNIFSFLPGPRNGLLVENFVDNPNDDELVRVSTVLRELEGAADIRDALDFHGLNQKLSPFLEKMQGANY